MNDVYINGRFLCNKMDGIARFSLEICRQMKRNRFSFTIVIPKWLDYSNEDGFNVVRVGYLRSHLWEQIDLFLFLKKKSSPLLLNFSGIGPVLYRKQIITIHDLAFFYEPAWFSKSYYLLYKLLIPIISKKCLKIFTVSEFSKREIVRCLEVFASKVFVVYNAPLRFKFNLNDVGEGRFSKRKFVLAVSSLDPRKNYKRLIKAFSDQAFKDYDLLLIGKSASHFKADFEKGNTENIKFLGHVSDTELVSLYSKAEVFIYPSLYEGFGIPPLEAMSYGCPVIASDIEAIREVCGNAVRYIDPYSVESIKEGLLSLINSDYLREYYKGLGFKAVEKYNWNESANRVISIVDNLYSNDNQ